MGQSQNTASPSDRFLIRSTATGTADANSMQNLNTAVLPNGAMCFVSATATMYYLDKTATTGGITPSSGPGQWKIFEVAEAAGGVAQVDPNGQSAFTVDTNWHATSGNSVLLDAITDAGSWALTPTGCILTYTGPTRKFLAQVSASVQVGDAGSARLVVLGISKNDDLTGAPTGGQPYADTTVTVVNSNFNVNASRIVSLSSGDTLRPKMAGPAAATSLTAALLMTVTPA